MAVLIEFTRGIDRDHPRKLQYLKLNPIVDVTSWLGYSVCQCSMGFCSFLRLK